MTNQATKTTQNTRTKRYFHGDEVKITGPAEVHFGGRFWPAVFVEGHRKGESIYIVVLEGEE